MTVAYWLAWLLVLAAGFFCVLAASPPRVSGRIFVALGYGAVLGMLLAAACTALSARADTANAWTHSGWWLAAVGVAAALVALLRQRGARGRATSYLGKNVDIWKAALIALALASLVWRGGLIGSEVLLRPTYPWDAWDAWAVKSKTWFLLGHYAPFMPVDQWLRAAGTEAFSGPGWAYPATLAWLQVWFASAAGSWVEPLVNLPWLVLWIGMLLGHYGQWRALGLCRTRAAIALYILGSLPLLSTHVALAGYADLWVAALFGFALLAWLRWQERRERDQLVLAVACATVLPLIKLEGMVWCLSLLAMFVFGALRPRWRWRVAIAGVALLALFVLVGKSQVLFAAIGWVRSGSHVVEIPVIGNLTTSWHGEAAAGIARSLFVQANWHLLWWFVPPIVVWRWRVLRTEDALGLCGMLLLACFGLLVFLFVFTDAAHWAESYTAVNRLVMQITPAVVTLLALLLREPNLIAEPDRTLREHGPPPGPA